MYKWKGNEEKKQEEEEEGSREPLIKSGPEGCH